MNTAIELLDEATSQGIKLDVAGGTIKCKSNNPIPPAIVSKLRENKTAILRLLEGGKARTTNGNNHNWIEDHEDELQEAGFTDRDLYGLGWYRGLADFLLWNKPGLRVELRGDQLCFTWQNQTGGRITQSCRPEQPQREENYDT